MKERNTNVTLTTEGLYLVSNLTQSQYEDQEFKTLREACTYANLIEREYKKERYNG